MAKHSIGQLTRQLQQLQDTVGQMSAILQQMQVASATGDTALTTPSAGGASIGGTGSSNSFMKYFYPTDSIGVAAGIGGRIANAVYKSKAAKQLARGNAAQHLAAGMSTPQSQAIFGSPLGSLAKVSADAGQANATTSLAKGEAWQGSLNDISNFISSINTMRRLMSGNALSAMGLWGASRILRGGNN
jgi:hypothetical protein